MNAVILIGRKGGLTGASHDDIFKKMHETADELFIHGFDIIVETETCQVAGSFPRYPIMSLNDLAELRSTKNERYFAVVFGGDGTMLDAARRLAGTNIPIVGVNQGRLGFITDLGKDVAIDELVKMLLHGSRTLEERALLCVDNGHDLLALNDIVINRVSGRIIEFQVCIDDVFAYQVRADGLLVSTPTGSTAYAMSAGGSIISPVAKVLEVMPMMPQTLSYRPLIINDSSKVTVKMLAGIARIFSDGNDAGVIKEGENISVFKSPRRALFMHPKTDSLTYDYYSMLREKLNWHLNPGSR